MHVALLTNTAWLDEQLQMFRHLVVGLIDSGVRVAQVVPDLLPQDDANTFGEVITWRDSRWPWVRDRRLVAVADQLGKLGVDVIHALDGRLWDAAAGLGRRLQVPLLLQATSVLDVASVTRHARAAERLRVAFAATTQPLRDAIAEQAAEDVPVAVIPPGVHVPAEVTTAPRSSVLCAVVSGTGELDQQYEAVLLALRELVDEHPQVQFFLDGQHADQHALWQAARRLRLLENVSLVPRRLGHREMLLKADLLIHPQAVGKARSLTLQAMACGVPVLALQDRWVDYLIDDQTAWLADSAQADRWLALFKRVLEHPDDAAALGQRARKWIGENRRPSDYVAATLDLYRTVTGESMKFPQEP